MYSISFDIFISGIKMMTVNSDGLLICSSCGSSAYNSSIRGPLMTPKSSNLILNFFAPFGTNCLPLVVNHDEQIEIRMSKSNWQNQIDVVLDSNTKITVDKGMKMIVKFDKENPVKLITNKTNILEFWLQKVNGLMKWDS
jgi:NAD kinase